MARASRPPDPTETGWRLARQPVTPAGRMPLGPMAIVAVGAAVLAVGLLGRTSAPRPEPDLAVLRASMTTSQSVVPVDAPAPPVRARSRGGPAPGQAMDLGSLPAASTLAERLPTGQADVVIGFGSTWLATTRDQTLRRLDPVTLEVVSEVVLPEDGSPTGALDLIVGGDSIWLAEETRSHLLRIDGAQPRTAGPIDIGGEVALVVAGQRAIWAATTDGTLVRVDVRRSGLLARLELGSMPVGLAVGRAAIWVSTADGVLHRVEPSGRRVNARYRLGGGRIGVGSGAIWVASGSTVVRIDEATGRTERHPIAVGDAFGVERSGDVFSAERFTYPADRRESWIAPNRPGLALGLGVWWRWDAELGILHRTPRRGS